MEKQAEKIKRFSKVIHILLKVAFIALIVVGVLEAFAWLWSVLNLHTETVTIGGESMELPLLFKFGEVKIYHPVAWKPGFELLGMSPISAVGFGDLLRTIFTIVGLWFAMGVFKVLRENGSPFREDVVKELKRFAIALLCMGVVSGVVPFLAAGVVWLLCLIFEYGHALQNERDTTL